MNKQEEHQQQDRREVVMVVGATGSLGKPIVAEFRRRGIPLRLVGRSWESFQEAGLLVEDKNSEGVSETTQQSRTDIVICKEMMDRNAFRDWWFTDVKLVVCMARPRGAKPEDYIPYVHMIRNLSNAVCVNKVPCMLMHGLPYLDKLVLGETPSFSQLRLVEKMARERFPLAASSSNNKDDKNSAGGICSQLVISRISEMSEIGFLLEASRMIRVWLCVRGLDPKLQPISARDFAVAVCDFAEKDHNCHTPMQELLVGGPQIITWRELGRSISQAIGRRHFEISLPLWVFSIWIAFFGFAKFILPFLEGLENVFKYAVMPMTANTTSGEFESVGSDRIEEFLREHAASDQATHVHNQIFHSRDESPSSGQRKSRLIRCSSRDAVWNLESRG